MIVVSSDILVEDGGSLEETPLEETFNKEVVNVMPRDIECVDPISIKFPLGHIPTPIFYHLHGIVLLFHGSLNVHLT